MPPRARRHVLREPSMFQTLRFKRHTRYVRWPYNPVDNCCLRRCTLEYIRKNFCAAPIDGQIHDVDVNTLTERTRRNIRSSSNVVRKDVHSLFLLQRTKIDVS